MAPLVLLVVLAVFAAVPPDPVVIVAVELDAVLVVRFRQPTVDVRVEVKL